MDVFTQIMNNRFIWIPFFTWLVIQTFKVIWDLVTTKKFNFKRIIGAGGMPSSHSAIVMAISVLVGRETGFNSWQFALSLVFSSVVMYDAAGVRRAAGKQARLLNKIIETPGLTGVQVQEKLVEVLGHTPLQVFVGAIIGIIIGSIF
jgi:acid phosphatase family membrane protein YuiD